MVSDGDWIGSVSDDVFNKRLEYDDGVIVSVVWNLVNVFLIY